MKPEQVQARAESAKRLLEDPIVKECFAMMEAEIINAIVSCPVRDLEGLRILKLELTRCRKFKSTLQGVIESGKLATHDLVQQENFLQQTLRKIRS